MSNYSGKPRMGWVHPKEATGLGAKEAAMSAGAGNITAEPPALGDVPNPKPSVSAEDYPTPRDSGGMADGMTGGNFAGVAPPMAPGEIPVQAKGGDEIGDE